MLRESLITEELLVPFGEEKEKETSRPAGAEATVPVAVRGSSPSGLARARGNARPKAANAHRTYRMLVESVTSNGGSTARRDPSI